MTLSALESAVEQITQQYVPVGVEHDPRVPPIGRVTKAWVKQLDDGHYALIAESEIFEPGDPTPRLDANNREIPIHCYPQGQLEVVADRGLRQPEDQAAVAEIAELLGTTPKEELKKALEPISVLTIAGGFVLGAAFSGFLARLGEDLYESLKAKVATLISRRRKCGQTTLLSLSLTMHLEDHQVEVQTIATDPEPNDVHQMLGPGLQDLDNLLPRLLKANPDCRRFVLEFSEGNLRFRFAVRRDGIPLFPAKPEKERPPNKSLQRTRKKRGPLNSGR